MVLCPRCGNPRLVQHFEIAHPRATVEHQSWTCTCGWEGRFPNRTKGSLLLAAEQRGIRVKRFTEAVRSLQESGDIILIVHEDRTKEVVI